MAANLEDVNSIFILYDITENSTMVGTGRRSSVVVSVSGIKNALLIAMRPIMRLILDCILEILCRTVRFANVLILSRNERCDSLPSMSRNGVLVERSNFQISKLKINH